MTDTVDIAALRELLEKWQSGPYRHVLVDIARALPALLSEVERRRADEAELVKALERCSHGTDDASANARSLLAKVKS